MTPFMIFFGIISFFFLIFMARFQTWKYFQVARLEKGARYDPAKKAVFFSDGKILVADPTSGHLSSYSVSWYYADTGKMAYYDVHHIAATKKLDEYLCSKACKERIAWAKSVLKD